MWREKEAESFSASCFKNMNKTSKCSAHIRIHNCTHCFALLAVQLFCGLTQASEVAWWTKVSNTPVKMPNVQPLLDIRQAVAVMQSSHEWIRGKHFRQTWQTIKNKTQTAERRRISGSGYFRLIWNSVGPLASLKCDQIVQCGFRIVDLYSLVGKMLLWSLGLSFGSLSIWCLDLMREGWIWLWSSRMLHACMVDTP